MILLLTPLRNDRSMPLKEKEIFSYESFIYFVLLQFPVRTRPRPFLLRAVQEQTVCRVRHVFMSILFFVS